MPILSRRDSRCDRADSGSRSENDLTKSIDKLLSIATDSLIRFPVDDSAVPMPNTALTRELVGFVRRRNGFYAFEAALHVFPLRSAGDIYGLDLWNAADTWVD